MSAGRYSSRSGRAETWNSLAEAAFAALGKKPQIEYIEMPESLRDRYQYYTKNEMGKLKALGYAREALSLNDAVKDYFQNYRLKEKLLGD